MMKKALTLAIAALGIGFSTVTLAGHDRDRNYYGERYGERYEDRYRYRHHDRHTVVIHKHQHGYKHRHKQKHWKSDHYGHRSHYRPGHQVVKHYHRHDDDLYKFIGGIYILNEVLHHDHH